MSIGGSSAQPMYVIASSDLRENGGNFDLEGGAAIPVYNLGGSNVPSGSSLSAGQVPQWNGSQFVGLFVDSWDFNFTANGDGYFYARVAMTVNLAGTAIGTGTLSYAKSTNAAPSTFSATTLPATLEAGAYFRVTVAGLSGFKALQIVRTA